MIKREIFLQPARSVPDIHEILADTLNFPAYYGGNLDALYECLAEIEEDTCVGIHGPVPEELSDYLPRVLGVFRDAERDNPRLCVFSFTDEKPPGGMYDTEELFAEEDAEMMGLYVGPGEENGENRF